MLCYTSPCYIVKVGYLHVFLLTFNSTLNHMYRHRSCLCLNKRSLAWTFETERDNQLCALAVVAFMVFRPWPHKAATHFSKSAMMNIFSLFFIYFLCSALVQFFSIYAVILSKIVGLNKFRITSVLKG